MFNDWFFITSVLLHAGSVFLFIGGKRKCALWLLVAGAILLRIWAALLDPFLNDWDEHFHALVAKNLGYNFLKPTLLIKPVLAYDYTNWIENHIWLHKQPLFLWQMALSIKLFGANEFAVRLPSVIQSTLLVLLTYRIASVVFNNRVAFISAFLFSCAYYPLMLVSGSMGMEHNDIAFMFYVTCSIWAWLEYEQSQNYKWLLLMGIFSGSAVLCKWLTGFLVFGIYGFSHLFVQKDLFTTKRITALLIALGVALAVCVPWQLYILYNYAAEANYEYAYNSRHFSEILENHHHHTWYYFDMLKFHYQLMQVFIFTGMLAAVVFWVKPRFTFAMMAGIVVVYAFFTLAATKLENYVLMIMPVMYVFLAYGLVLAFDMVTGKLSKPVSGTLLVAGFAFLFYLNFNHTGFENDHKALTPYWQMIRKSKLINTAAYKAINKKLPANSVIAWCYKFQNIDVMFYTNYTAYGDISQKSVEEIKRKGMRIAVFNRSNLPDYLLQDSAIIHLPYTIINNH